MLFSQLAQCFVTERKRTTKSRKLGDDNELRWRYGVNEIGYRGEHRTIFGWVLMGCAF